MLRLLCVVVAIVCHFANGQVEYGLSCVSDDIAQVKSENVQLKQDVAYLKEKYDVLISKQSELETKLTEADARLTSDVGDISAEIAGREKCQSGIGLGIQSWPEYVFPYSSTVMFDPPFKSVPEFTYGMTFLDASMDTRVNITLVDLTPESFTIDFQSWEAQTLWGAKVSWMACPK